jgi:hypothetical protein
MYELRYLVRNGWDGPEKVLQYRNYIEVTDYSVTIDKGGFTKLMKWTEWKDVPVVKDE